MARKRIRETESIRQRVRGNKELILVDLFDPKTGETYVKKFHVDVNTYCNESDQSKEYHDICSNIIDDITGMEMSVIKKPKGANA